MITIKVNGELDNLPSPFLEERKAPNKCLKIETKCIWRSAGKLKAMHKRTSSHPKMLQWYRQKFFHKMAWNFELFCKNKYVLCYYFYLHIKATRSSWKDSNAVVCICWNSATYFHYIYILNATKANIRVKHLILIVRVNLNRGNICIRSKLLPRRNT